MDCECLNIVGNIASIITVIGGVYGFCKWVKSRQARPIATKYHSERNSYILYIRNEGLADARNIKITDSKVQSYSNIAKLQPDEEQQISFTYSQQSSSLSLKIRWTDGMGNHTKRIAITSSMKLR